MAPTISSSQVDEIPMTGTVSNRQEYDLFCQFEISERCLGTLFSAFALSKAAFSKGYQSTGFVACCLRYGDFAVANRFKCRVAPVAMVFLVTVSLFLLKTTLSVVLLGLKYGTLEATIPRARLVLNIKLPHLRNRVTPSPQRNSGNRAG